MRIVTFKILRESSKRRLYVIPYLFTFANAFLGFLAVIRALDGDYAIAAQCIVLAAIMDMLDGRLARMLDSTSSIGMELDSLCDAVSFCFAPAIILYCWCLCDIGNIGLGVLALYLCCGLLRLARFNVHSSEHQSYFSGLPSTMAALCTASLILHAPWFDAHRVAVAAHGGSVAILVGVLAGLMIAPVRFPSCKRISKRVMLISGASLIGLVIWSLYANWPIMLMVPFGYVMMSVAYDGYVRARAALHQLSR